MPIGVMYGLVTGISEQITPAGLAYLTMPLSGSSSMTPMLFCRSASRRMPSTLRAAPRFAAAHAAFVDAHVGQARRGVGIRAGPADRLAEAIDPGLVVAADGVHGTARVGQQTPGLLGFSWGNRSCGHKSMDRERADYGDPSCILRGCNGAATVTS